MKANKRKIFEKINEEIDYLRDFVLHCHLAGAILKREDTDFLYNISTKLSYIQGDIHEYMRKRK